MISNNKDSVVRTIIGQLECDEILGGKWLPIEGAKELFNHNANQSTIQNRTSGDQQQFKGQLDMSKAKNKTKLESIAEQIVNCQKCQLGKSRINVVPGDGNPTARIVFVGEAPGATEDQQGKPFVGRAGQLLTNIIEAMGLKRQDVYICNILKCRPPNNRDPQADEISQCNGYLHEQLKIIGPEVIVALGAHAARTLLETNKAIGTLRGTFHQYIPGQNAKPIKLMATYHPSYLLRNYTKDARLRVWQDMQMVLRELGLPIPKKKK